MKSENFQRGFLLLLVAAVTVFFLWMIRAFIVPLLLAAIFANSCRPIYLRFNDWFRGRKGYASGATLLVFTLLIVLPLFGFLGIVANEAAKVTETVAPYVQEKLGNREALMENVQRLPGFKYLAPYTEQILNKIAGAVSGVGNFIFKGASALTAGTLIFVLNFAIMLYAMFFFIKDGPAILEKILFYMPLDDRDERKLLGGFQSMARATIKSLVVIGILQGTLAALSFLVAGIPSVLFWGTVMAVLSMVPNIGSALVWVPASIYLFVKGDTGAAIGVFIWCAVVVSMVDNLLRPILVGKDTQVPELLVLLSTLGGITMFGLAGFILGPVLALLFLSVWDIYGQTFKNILPKPRV